MDTKITSKTLHRGKDSASEMLYHLIFYEISEKGETVEIKIDYCVL